jgi:hypothetical protein
LYCFNGKIYPALFAWLASGRLVSAGGLGCGLLWLIPAMVAIVVRDGLGDFFRGKMAWTAKMQNIICD